MHRLNASTKRFQTALKCNIFASMFSPLLAGERPPAHASTRTLRSIMLSESQTKVGANAASDVTQKNKVRDAS